MNDQQNNEPQSEEREQGSVPGSDAGTENQAAETTAKAAPARRTRSRRATSATTAPKSLSTPTPEAGSTTPDAESAASEPQTGAAGTDQPPSTGPQAPEGGEPAQQAAGDAEQPAEKPKRTRRASTGTAKAAEPKTPAKRTTSRTKKTATDAAADATADAAGGTDAAVQAAETAGAEIGAVAEKAAEAAAEKPKRTRKAPTRKKAEDKATETGAGEAATDASGEHPTAEQSATEQPAADQQSATSSAADSGEVPAAESPATETTDQAEAAPAPARRRTRRAGAPARSPEQKLDVFAELGLGEPAAVGTASPATSPEAEGDETDETDETASPDEAEVAETAAEAGAQAEGEGDEGPRLPAAALLFQAPDLTKARPRRRAQAPAGAPVPRVETAEEEPEAEADRPAEERPSRAEAEPAEQETDDESTDGDEEHGGARRRRRRGGRGRRNRGGPSGNQDDAEDSDDEDTEDSTAEEPEEDTSAQESDEDQGQDEGEEGGPSSRRRRRRRRSSGSGGSSGSSGSSGSGGSGASGGTARPADSGRDIKDEVTALKGSTRLEAKRQRRREGREAGRRRPTLSESEFLARRESVKRTMIVREKDGLNQIAVLEDGILVEHYVAAHTQTSMVGNVYLGRVQNVLPSMEAAFVDLGKGRNAVLYAGEVNWDAAGMEGQPRRIEQALKSGDSILVQVTKDPIGHKGARLTSQITLAGRHLVLVPSGAMTGISRKLPENERARLKKLLKEIVPEGAGVIVRTAAEGASEEQLRTDVERLTKQWADIETKAKNAKSAPVLLKGEPELAVRVVRDVFNEDFESLVVSGDTAWQTISTYVKDLSPDLADRMHHWTSERDVFHENRVDEQLAKGMDRKVWLPSGGSLVIDRTEAMTVVDVNTGKFTGSGGTLEETVTRNNLEAAEEIVRQLRLRDIGGIIVVDFIDMVLESNRDLVMRRLLECLGRDRTRHQVAEVTSLGLVQMTRKRVGQGLVEAFSTPCEHCHGRGFIVHNEPVEKNGSDGGERPSDDGGSSSRRRGRRGGGAGAGTPEPTESSPDEAPAEDPAARAAREAVKATLATIAAAAAHAHDPKEEGGEAGPGSESGAEAVSSAQTTEAPAPSVSSPDLAAGATSRRQIGTIAQSKAGAPAEGTAGAEGPRAHEEVSTETEKASGRPSRRRKAGRPAGSPDPGGKTAAPAVSGVIGVPATAPAASEGAGSEGAETQPDSSRAPVATSPAVAPSEGSSDGQPPSVQPQAVEPPAAEPAAAQPARRPRRSRRAVSSGVVTPGETGIITIQTDGGTGGESRSDADS